MSIIPADPGATDGLSCVCRFHSVESAKRQGSETGVLVDPDEPIQECDLHKALRERVAELEGVLKTEEVLTDEYVSRTEAAEAQMAALAGALKVTGKLAQVAVAFLATGFGYTEDKFLAQDALAEYKKIKVVLAATPEQALERARAVEEALSVLRGYYATKFGQHAMVKQVGIFLAKLDALGKE